MHVHIVCVVWSKDTGINTPRNIITFPTDNPPSHCSSGLAACVELHPAARVELHLAARVELHLAVCACL